MKELKLRKAAPFYRSADPKPLMWLGWGTIMLLLGRGWQYVFWATPWSAWWPWLGIILGLGGWWLSWRLLWGFSADVGLGVVGLILLVHLGWKVAEHGWRWVDALEHTLAWSTPLLLWGYWRRLPRRSYLARLAVAATFTGHGLFALGWPYATPPHFVFMTQSILGVSTNTALGLLRVAGSLDLLVSLAIFVPRVWRLALIYAVIWGSLTALARPMAYVTTESLLPDLHRWVMEMLWRLPHALVPLALWHETRR